MKSFPTALFCILGSIQLYTKTTEAVRCYTCQYSDGPSMIGYECVTSPADYTLGPTTTECADGCQIESQSINSWSSIWYLARGCKNKPAGCTSGSADICVETCDGPDLCNDKNIALSTIPTTSPASTIPPTTTTEIPGTRWCYSCVYSYHPDIAPICVDDPANVPSPNQVRCPPSRACTIFRQWDKGNQVVRSFTRGCEEQQGKVNECIEDTYFTTCFTYCNEEYCNSGDGTLPLADEAFKPLPPPTNG